MTRVDAPDPIHFERADVARLDAVLCLIAEYYAFDHIPFDAAVLRGGLLRLLSNEAIGGAWLIQLEGATVGYFVLTYGFDLEFGGPQATVTELFLRAEARGAGLGRAAIAFIEQHLRARGIATCELQVERRNERARAFYLGMGFQAHDRIPLSKRLELPATVARGVPAGPLPASPCRAGNIRPARPAETESLVALAVETGLFRPEEADLLLRQTLEELHSGRLGEGHFAHVREDEHEGSPTAWAYFSASAKADAVWDLWWIGVAPARQGSGVGSELLAFVEEEVRQRGGRVLLIETSALPQLAATRAFYRRRGYLECGCVPDFYGPGDGKITFAKTLAPQSARRP